MPSPKRWYPESRDVNEDPEVWELTDTFGERALRLKLEVFALIDRSENRWRLSGQWLASLSRKVRQQPATVWSALRWMVDKGWLTIEETAADGSPLVLSARNYWKYHKRRESHGAQCVSTVGADTGPSLPNLSFPNIPNIPKEGEEGSVRGVPAAPAPTPVKNKSPVKIPFPENFQLTEELRQYALRKGITDPAGEFEHFRDHHMRSRDLFFDWEAAWRTWVQNGIKKYGANRPGPHTTQPPVSCTWQIREGYKTVPCKKPVEPELAAEGSKVCREHKTESDQRKARVAEMRGEQHVRR